jgi:hypothetical protein
MSNYNPEDERMYSGGRVINALVVRLKELPIEEIRKGVTLMLNAESLPLININSAIRIYAIDGKKEVGDLFCTKTPWESDRMAEDMGYFTGRNYEFFFIPADDFKKRLARGREHLEFEFVRSEKKHTISTKNENLAMGRKREGITERHWQKVEEIRKEQAAHLPVSPSHFDDNLPDSPM